MLLHCVLRQAATSATLALLIAAGTPCDAEAAYTMSDTTQHAAPAPDSTSFWVRNTDSDTVLVFIHGVNSTSLDTWTYHRGRPDAIFWPRILTHDPSFDRAAIFVAGYPADTQDVEMSVSKAVDTVLAELKDSSAGRPVLQRKHILVVAHSLGGIVARALLQRLEQSPYFLEADVGLLLMASPADGAAIANWGRRIGKKFVGKAAYTLLRQLETRNSALEDLNMWSDRALADGELWLVGRAKCERNRIWLVRVVSEESCKRYFESEVMRGFDHQSIVKPVNESAPPHQALVAFYTGPFQTLIRRSPNHLRRLTVAAEYERIGAKQESAGDTIDVTVGFGPGDTVKTATVPLRVIGGSTAITFGALTYAAPSLPAGVTLTAEAAGPDAVALTLRRPAAYLASDSAGVDTARTLAPVPVPDSAKLPGLRVPVRVQAIRLWSNPGLVLESYTSAPVELTPVRRKGQLATPPWRLDAGQSMNVRLRVVQYSRTGTTTSHPTLSEANKAGLWNEGLSGGVLRINSAPYWDNWLPVKPKNAVRLATVN